MASSAVVTCRWCHQFKWFLFLLFIVWSISRPLNAEKENAPMSSKRETSEFQTWYVDYDDPHHRHAR